MSTPSCYQITIAGGGTSVPGEGFIDNLTAQHYLANAVGALDANTEASLDNLPPAFNLAASYAKKRANLRYNAVVAQLGLIGNIYLSNAVATGASAIAAGSSFQFNALVEHGDASLQTWDEFSPGGKTLLSVPAVVLARAVARGLMQDNFVQAEVLDPTPAPSLGILGASHAVPRFGMRYVKMEVGPSFANMAAATSAIGIVQIF